MSHELFLTKRQKTIIRHAFAQIIKGQTSKIIKSGGFLGSWLRKLAKKVVTNHAIPFSINNLPRLVSNIVPNAASKTVYKFERRTSGKRAVRVGKRFPLFILNEDMDDIIKIVKSLEDSEVLVDGFTEVVKDEMKKQEGGFVTALLAPVAASVIQLVTSSVANDIAGRGAMRAGRGYNNMDKHF